MTVERNLGLWSRSLLLLVLVGGVAFTAIWARNTAIGVGDFGAYWTASRLFSMGQNPCDPENLLDVQRAHVWPNRDWAMMVWNVPTTWVLLLPLAGMPFETARAVWLVTNLGLLLASCFVLHRLFFDQKRVKTLALLSLLGAVFPPVLVAVIYGQLTFLVLFGLSASILLARNGRWTAAGAVLILTTPKPHLVLLSFPYLVMYMAVRRKWEGWLGLALAGSVCAVVLFALRPTWINDYLACLNAPLQDWQTPTVGGVLRSLGAGPWVHFLGVGLLGLLPLFLRNPSSPRLEQATGFLTLVTIPTTFFGWSYDQSLLLVPIAHILSRLTSPEASGRARLVVGRLGLLTLPGSGVHRVFATNEIVFVWVPLAWAGVYAVTLAMTGGAPSLPRRARGGVDRA